MVLDHGTLGKRDKKLLTDWTTYWTKVQKISGDMTYNDMVFNSTHKSYKKTLIRKAGNDWDAYSI